MATQKRKRRLQTKCNQKNGKDQCPGKYQLVYDGKSPLFICDSCSHTDYRWKKFYEEYSNIFKTKENWETKKHQVTCIIGFFMYKFNEFYGVDYSLVPKNPNPYGIKECKDAWSLLATFKNDGHEVRRYTHWVFSKGISRGTNITSFGYIVAPWLIRKYQLYVNKKRTLTRSSLLPAHYIEWCRENTPDIFKKYSLSTMNDLGSLLQYTSVYSLEDSIESLVICKAKQIGLIKNNRLNTG
jgi:hypothetical protein